MAQRAISTLPRRAFLSLSGSAVCALGLSLVATSDDGLSAPAIAFAEEAFANENMNDEYSFVPEDALTPDDISSEAQLMSVDTTPVVELGGVDRYETVAKEALYAFPSSKNAIVASGVGYADSLSAGALAGALNCPLLLTNSNSVPDVTAQALRSLGVSNIILLGDANVASAGVERTLRAFGSVKRICGVDRYATQMAVYRYGMDNGFWTGDTVIVTSATGFADAVSASPLSYALKAPIFFCDASRTLPAAQRNALSSELTGVKNFLMLGDQNVTSDETLNFLKGIAAGRGGSAVRLGGTNRYQTSMIISAYAVEHFGFKWDGAAFSSGLAPYDALGGGVVQGKERSVILLADRTSAVSVGAITSAGASVNSIKFLGDTNAVPGDVRVKFCSTLGLRYLMNTSFVSYNVTRSHMAQLQVNRNEGNGYSYNDFYNALNPDQYQYGTSDFYQFAVLSNGYSGMSSNVLDNYIATNCIYQESSRGRTSTLRGLGSTFTEAAKSLGVNETYLLAHAIWESAWGCSDLATGWVPDEDGEVIVNGVSYPYKRGTRYYNFYGIGAVDSNALPGGRALAVKEGWDTPDKAVFGAAKWIKENYLSRSSGPQNTLYLMKWDVVGVERGDTAWHEYCTGLGTWCAGIGSVMDRCYKSAGWEFGANLTFSVPVYAN